MGTSMHFGASKELILFARLLRQNMTLAEKELWKHIHNKLLGHKFRNQHAIYKYVVDFYCHELKLFIEVDGSIHTLTEIALNDKDREYNLLSLGLHIIRFTNDEIFNDIEKVLLELKKKIDEILNATPPLTGDEFELKSPLGAYSSNSSPL
jgi:cyclase